MTRLFILFGKQVAAIDGTSRRCHNFKLPPRPSITADQDKRCRTENEMPNATVATTNPSNLATTNLLVKKTHKEYINAQIVHAFPVIAGDASERANANIDAINASDEIVACAMDNTSNLSKKNRITAKY